MGYESRAVVAAAYSLHKRGIPTNNERVLIEELEQQTTATTQSECKVCYDNAVDAFLLPCRHSSLCMDCANACKSGNGKCPICLQDITDVFQMYLA
jgi:hypothetical protein